MNTDNKTILQWAKYYASINWPIIPLHTPNSNGQCSCNNSACNSIGKHPRCAHGHKEATTDQSTIETWWNRWPNANIGIVTGKGSNQLVIDIDPRHGGFTSLKTLERKNGPFEGIRVHTGGGGLHYYYDTKFHSLLNNKVNVLPGVDIRGEGGFVVAPPSTHATGISYTWDDHYLERKELPKHLEEHLYKKKQTDNLIRPIKKKVLTGERNNFLTSLAGSLRKYGLHHSAIQDQLLIFNKEFCSPALTTIEINRISKSISNYPSESQIQWGPVKELKTPSYIVDDMKEIYVPKKLKAWVLDITDRMQVPIEYVITPILVSIASLIGKKIGIHPKKNDDWLVVPNLWGGLVARPGSLKSPAIAEALKPFEKIVESENKTYLDKLQEWEIEKNINDATLTAIKEQYIKAIKKNANSDAQKLREKLAELQKEIKESRPEHKRIKTNDATVEKLSELLLKNPNGLLVIRDELSGWLKSLNKYGRDGDREFYLESWNGLGSYTIDRIGRGTLHIPSVCISIFGGIQPDKLNNLLADPLNTNDDGLLQRFQLLVFPESSKTWKNIDRSPNSSVLHKVHTLYEKIHQFNSQEILKVHFTRSAQTEFDKWRTDLEKTLRNGSINNSQFESHLAKFRSLLPSLALVFHVVGNIDNDKFVGLKIGSTSLRLAIKWCKILQLHAKKIYRVNSNKYHHSILALSKKIKNKQIKSGDNFRAIYRNNWQHLNTKEKIDHAVEYLEELNWVKVTYDKSSHKRTKVLQVNPKLLSEENL